MSGALLHHLPLSNPRKVANASTNRTDSSICGTDTGEARSRAAKYRTPANATDAAHLTESIWDTPAPSSYSHPMIIRPFVSSGNGAGSIQLLAVVDLSVI
jgi:hypothetical protein